MTAHIEDVLLYAIAQKGDRYIFGAEARATDPNPAAFDCSELVEWACARAGVDPRVPDGAYYQREHCRKAGMGIPVGQGLRTRGALLFVGDGIGVGRDAITHVAWSLGDGTTIEARGSQWGVGTWPSTNRFDFAALIPGVDYSPGHGRLNPEEDELMAVADDIAHIKSQVDKIRSTGIFTEQRIIDLAAFEQAQQDPAKFAAAVAGHLPDAVDQEMVEAAFRNVLTEGVGGG